MEWIKDDKGNKVWIKGSGNGNGLPIGNENTGPDDLTSLQYIHQASVLESLDVRFGQKKAYTFVGSVLISVNPIVELEEISHEGALGQPHPFGVAENCFQQLKQDAKDQCVIISGESGAGKSEACKRVIKHLVVRSSTTDPSVMQIEDKLLAANPILEAFGNASTLMNNNSSRFGKFVKLYFNEDFTFKNAGITTYLLERSRIVSYNPGERSYHIFYQLLAAGDAATTGVSDSYKRQVKQQVDAEYFSNLVKSMEIFEFSKEEQRGVFDIVAAIMHLMQVTFEDEDSMHGNVAKVAGFVDSFTTSAKLLGIDPKTLSSFLLQKSLKIRGEVTITHRDAANASQTRDALVKALYHELFHWVVTRINCGLGHNADSSKFVGILDIFGFESFEVNRFEQVLINYANDVLQSTFNKQLFEGELDMYMREGLNVQQPVVVDDTCMKCISLFQSREKQIGLLRLIDNVCVEPDPSDKKLLDNMKKVLGGKPCFEKVHPRIANQAFTITHYAKSVTYQIEGFVDKNLDALNFHLDEICGVSTNPALTQLENATKAKKKTRSIVSKFEKQIEHLVTVLNDTRCSFIRCVKPNIALNLKAGFDRSFVDRQLTCLSVPQTVQTLQAGYPGKIKYEQLFALCVEKGVINSELLQSDLQNWQKRIIIKVLMRNSSIPEDQVKFGKTRLFCTSTAMTTLYDSLSETSALTEEVQNEWVIHALRRQAAVYALIRRRQRLLRHVVLAQAQTRMFLARREYQKHIRKDKAIVEVQSWIRATLARRAFLRVVEAASTIALFWKLYKPTPEEEEEEEEEKNMEELLEKAASCTEHIIVSEMTETRKDTIDTVELESMVESPEESDYAQSPVEETKDEKHETEIKTVEEAAERPVVAQKPQPDPKAVQPAATKDVHDAKTGSDKTRNASGRLDSGKDKQGNGKKGGFFKKLGLFEKNSAESRQHAKVIAELTKALKRDDMTKIIEFTTLAKKMKVDHPCVKQGEEKVRNVMREKGMVLLREAVQSKDTTKLSLAIRHASKFDVDNPALMDEARSLLATLQQRQLAQAV